MAGESRQPRRVVIPGGSGNVGRLLAQHFHSLGDRVTVLSRSGDPAPTPWRTAYWDGLTEARAYEELDGADICIHLSGRSVNTRATPKHREEIYDSRIRPTMLLSRVMRRVPRPPSVWLNASTATVYRHALDRPQDEYTGEMGGFETEIPRAWQFNVKVGRDWEASMFSGDLPRTRRVALRTSLVMSPQPGSVFAVLSKLVRLGLGGTNGKGDQRVSWIHANDYVRAIDLLVADARFTGPVNLSAPASPTNADLMRTLRDAWGVRFGPRAPEFLIELGCWLMRTEPELVLKSRWVAPGKLLDAGFQFEFSDWRAAAGDLVQQMRAARA